MDRSLQPRTTKRKLEHLVDAVTSEGASNNMTENNLKKIKVQSSFEGASTPTELSLSFDSPTSSVGPSALSRSGNTSSTGLSSLPSPLNTLPHEVSANYIDIKTDPPRLQDKAIGNSLEQDAALREPTKTYRVANIIPQEERAVYCPIAYVYDYLAHNVSWFQPQPLAIPSSVRAQLDAQPDEIQNQTRANAVQLTFNGTNLPVHSGLTSFRQSKHWKVNFDASTELLQLFADDNRCQEATLTNGSSMSTWAIECLKRNVPESVSRFAVYMFPDADEERTWLLCQLVILIFIFDDMWEHASPIITDHIRDDFIARVKGQTSSSISDTPLQKRLTDIHDRFLKCDEQLGNAGGQALDTLIQFCRHSFPRSFTGIQDYLDYRDEDIANNYSWACAKFSIGSSVDQDDPRFSRFLRLLGDQISIVNDIASYDKERVEFESGKAAHFTNLVYVIMDLNKFRPEVAKNMAYALQLNVESDLADEIEVLKTKDLTLDEWRFLEACLHAASGNLFTSIVISRYGGEGARIV